VLVPLMAVGAAGAAFHFGMFNGLRRGSNAWAQGYTTGFVSTEAFQAAPDYGQQPGAGGTSEMSSGPLFQSPLPPQQQQQQHMLAAQPAGGAASL
jgi:hypothetical protein